MCIFCRSLFADLVGWRGRPIFLQKKTHNFWNILSKLLKPNNVAVPLFSEIMISSLSSFLKTSVPISRVYKPLPGADPGFQVRGGGAHLKKLRRAEGGAKILGVFRVKIHDFTPKKQITESPSYP